MAKDIFTKIMVCPSAWLYSLLRCRGYTNHIVRSLMDSFKYEASELADQLTLNEQTWTITTSFANSDYFLDWVEAELGTNFSSSTGNSTNRSVKTR
jgi:hypothetical protein